MFLPLRHGAGSPFRRELHHPAARPSVFWAAPAPARARSCSSSAGFTRSAGADHRGRAGPRLHARPLGPEEMWASSCSSLFSSSQHRGDNIGVCGAKRSEIRAAACNGQHRARHRGLCAGYETLVGERGVTLSGGQKQRGRHGPHADTEDPIIVFDDSLSAVDTVDGRKDPRALEKDLQAPPSSSSPIASRP
jgi:hypothetical protein